jgi:hypothetical protein
MFKIVTLSTLFVTLAAGTSSFSPPALAQDSGSLVTCHLNQFEIGVKAATSSTTSWTAPSMKAGLEYGRSLVLPTDYTRVSCLSLSGDIASLQCGVTVKFHTDGNTSASRLSCAPSSPVPQESATVTQTELDRALLSKLDAASVKKQAGGWFGN